jgi:plastocyanin
MKKRKKQLIALLACLLLWGGAGMAQAANPPAPVVTFHASDAPGSWFECSSQPFNPATTAKGCVPAGIIDAKSEQKSLAIIKTGETIAFTSDGQANTLHTAVSLIYPKGAKFTTSLGANQPSFDTDLEPNSHSPFNVTLTTPGLYVFFCDIHPYMFAGVIVANHPKDALTTSGFTLGGQAGMLTLQNVVLPTLDIPSASDLALRLLRTFFIATDPNNWQDFSKTEWSPKYPPVLVNVVDQSGAALNQVPLATTLSKYFHEPKPLDVPSMPPTAKGVGQVWVDTQFEKTGKSKPGTATAVNATTWAVERKVGLNLNNPHNMWTNQDQSLIYQTEWFDNYLTVFERTTGKSKGRIEVGNAPAHVMTRTDTNEVHVSQNGGNNIVELTPGATAIIQYLPMHTDGENTHPHAHWMSADGKMMVTPNPDTEDSTLYEFRGHSIAATTGVGHFPIATGMMPDSSKYYVANFLDSSISVIKIIPRVNDTPTAEKVTTIDLLGLNLTDLTQGCYNPIAIDLALGAGAPITVPHIERCNGSIGALPIQTPVSPDGRFMITANTLTANILITDTVSNTVVATLACDAGCHGVAFGAKKGGGYYAYVSSKFSNRMIVIDVTPKEGLPAIVGSVLLTPSAGTDSDGKVSAYPGMGGQGVLPIPLVYNGWVQKLPEEWKEKLTYQQRHPIGGDHR